MSSLLDGIDVGEADSKSSKSSGGPDPKIIKGAIAGALFLIAGVVLAMQFDIIPKFWGNETVTNRQGEAVQYTPKSEEEIRKITEKLEADEAEFIRRGGVIGGS